MFGILGGLSRRSFLMVKGTAKSPVVLKGLAGLIQTADRTVAKYISRQLDISHKSCLHF